jgi:hypothetical protein
VVCRLYVQVALTLPALLRIPFHCMEILSTADHRPANGTSPFSVTIVAGGGFSAGQPLSASFGNLALNFWQNSRRSMGWFVVVERRAPSMLKGVRRGSLGARLPKKRYQSKSFLLSFSRLVSHFVGDPAQCRRLTMCSGIHPVLAPMSLTPNTRRVEPDAEGG